MSKKIKLSREQKEKINELAGIRVNNFLTWLGLLILYVLVFRHLLIPGVHLTPGG